MCVIYISLKYLNKQTASNRLALIVKNIGITQTYQLLLYSITTKTTTAIHPYTKVLCFSKIIVCRMLSCIKKSVHRFLSILKTCSKSTKEVDT